MGRGTVIGVLGLAALLSACQAAAPGYIPPSDRTSEFKGPLIAPGTMADAATYVVSDDERKLDCRRLTGSIQIIISRLRDAPNRTQPSAFASGAQKTAKAVIGGTSAGADRGEDLARERGRAEAYNRLLAEKKCKTIDIGAELRKPAPALPPPAQTKKS